MTRVTIAGGTGFTAGELIRLLYCRKDVLIASVTSTSCADRKITDVHRDLLGDIDLTFSEEPAGCDVLFLCLGHGLSRAYLEKYSIPQECRIIDLGNDFRIEDTFGKRKFVYGLTDLNRNAIENAGSIANPGCFATAILLGIVPFAVNGLLKDEIHVTALTGATGAGKKLQETTQFNYRSGNISVYKPFTHQHLEEIRKTIAALNGGNTPQINFVPMRGDFTRGIFASIYTRVPQGFTQENADDVYKEFYKDSPFVHISDAPISMKEVVNTNKCLIHTELHQGYLLIESTIDNLIKGASGQAVENMNLMLGLDEAEGLKLKPSCF
ncbi:MAG: N-acetyl-gamma-glutamyl-phosphate reductase [Bacteroidales bacterium]|jgi:N-acetyl-gamma-glutamyl-phosphate reductase|nr:N-acetyl-gamma-glutamyl-phosphate reductase [Bacteroidales bacterium]MCI2121784.1 N-acetyl-gamma-glutamyl-phosphate reductase [Bacteroidales bacterium]MCI2146015.1 N-acetyl-gamma-glutamyl-phosphate reductase [Bacteroidales bacterium]